MTTLIDRYVFTVLRRVPERQRPDIERELRASIADAVDARVEAGEPETAAVEAVLLELGDPDRLADGYADRRQYLIGPDVFPVWRRLLTLLVSTVLPIVVTITVVVKIVEGAGFGPIIGAAISSAITVGAHLAFWTTAVFALIERTGVTRGDLPLRHEWKPADLPKYEPGFLTPSQLIPNLVWPVLLIVALILQQFAFTDEPVLNPANWSFWWPFLIVVLILECAYAVWLFRRRAWTHTVTAANAALALLTAAPVVWLLATDRFLNPAYLDSLGWGTDQHRWLTWTIIAVTVIGVLFDVADTAIRAERTRRGLVTEIPGTAV